MTPIEKKKKGKTVKTLLGFMALLFIVWLFVKPKDGMPPPSPAYNLIERVVKVLLLVLIIPLVFLIAAFLGTFWSFLLIGLGLMFVGWGLWKVVFKPSTGGLDPYPDNVVYQTDVVEIIPTPSIEAINTKDKIVPNKVGRTIKGGKVNPTNAQISAL